jgi:glycosyltransferase involved in cell wall biosynthesis
MFKVLVVAYYFPPMGLSGVQRTLKFTRYMKDYNWEPTVITSGNVAYYAYDRHLLKEAEDAGIRIFRTEAFHPNAALSKFGTIKLSNEWLRKLLSMISQIFYIPDNKKAWSKKAGEFILELLKKEKFDVIFISSPPFSAFYEISKLKKEINLPIIIDYRDSWYKSHLSFYLTPIHQLLNKKREYFSLKAADKIIVVNRKIKEELLKVYKFLTFEDIVIIPHGYDPLDFKDVKPLPKSSRKMILTYSGIFYGHNTPEYFLNAFYKLKQERPDAASNIELHFVGYLNKSTLKQIKKLKLEEFIHAHGYLDHDEAVRRIVSSDVLWLMIGNWKNKQLISLGKIMEYVGSRKPFIACVPDGATKITAEAYKAAFITEPDNIEQIKNTLLHVYELYTKNELPVPDEDFILQHRRDYLTEQLTKQLQFHLKVIS